MCREYFYWGLEVRRSAGVKLPALQIFIQQPHMKINYKNTALGLIDNTPGWTFAFPPNMCSSDEEMKTKELEAWGRSILKNGKGLKDIVGNNIQYVSESFWQAYMKGRYKLKDIFDKEQIEEAGTIILSSDVHNGFTHTYYYYIKTFGNGETWDYSLLFMDFSKHPKNNEPHLDVYISRDSRNDNHVKYASVIWKDYLDRGLDNGYWETLIITFVLFKKYCDIETKVIDPKKNRRAVVAGQKYLNETDKRIQVLDATWFTNLVVSGAFGVTGHLRLQPYGPGLKQKKIIWIDDYTKEGYTRKAKVLIEQEK